MHCCASDPPLELMAEAGAVSIDAALPVQLDVLGELLERGTGVLLGVVPSTDGPLPSVKAIVEIVGRLRDRVGMKDVTLTPTCGLAGASQDYAPARP